MNIPPLFDGKYINLGIPNANVGIGDCMIMTAVAREVKKKFPDYPIKMTITNGKFLFENNPNIDLFEVGVNPYQDSVGRGHYALRKCRLFGIEDADIRGELFFTQKEIDVARTTLNLISPDKPTIMMCYNSADVPRSWTKEGWTTLVNVVNKKYNVFQLESTIYYGKDAGNDPPRLFEAIPGARQELRNLDLRKIAALMSLSKKYLGSDTAFSHIATCFGYDNYIYFLEHPEHYPNWAYPQNKNFIENRFSMNDLIASMEKDWMK